MKKLIFIGSLGAKDQAARGDTVKNHLLLEKLSPRFSASIIIDTKGWFRKPWVLVHLLLCLLFLKQATIVISIFTKSANRLFKYGYPILKHRKVYYFVLGGTVADRIEQGIYNIKYYKHLTYLFVETNRMRDSLIRSGVKNVMKLYNFKKQLPTSLKTQSEDIVRYVFLSRIVPEKGCDLIFEAIRQLNDEGCQDRFSVTFYGLIREDYAPAFLQNVALYSNCTYKGILNMNLSQDVETFRSHDVLLLPTLYLTEGFPACIIDAYQAGMPVIITDWTNNEYVEDGKTGLLIERGNQAQLIEKMKLLIEDRAQISSMKQHCLQEAGKYNIDQVLSDDFLNSTGL